MKRLLLSNRLLEHAGSGWLVASVCCWLVAIVPSVCPLDFPRLACACAAIFVLPGRLGQALFRRPSQGLLDDVAHATALAIPVLAACTIIWMQLALSSVSLAYLLLGVGTVGALLGMLRCPSGEREPGGPSLPFVVAAVGIAALTAIFYAIGGCITPVPVGEELMHVSIVRKIHALAHLDINGLMYMPNVASTYLFPPYHMGLALVAHLSHLDPITVFMKFRPCAMWVALSAMYGVLLALSRQRRVADWGLLVMVVLLFTNVGGQVAAAGGGGWFYWAQLAPVAHLGDFGLGVMLPLLLYVLARFLVTDRPCSEETVTLVLLALASIVIHSRETIQLLLYANLILVAVVLSSRTSRERWMLVLRLVVVSAIVVGGAKLFLFQHHAHVQHAVIYDTAQKVQALQSLHDLLALPWWGLTADALPLSDSLMLRDFYALGIILMPLTLLFWPQRWAWFLGATVVGYVMVLRVPAIAYYYCRFTYSEIFMTPVRNVVLQVILLVCLVSYVLWREGLRLWNLAESPGRRVLVAAGVGLFSLLVFGIAPPILSPWAMAHKNIFYGIFGLLVLLALLARGTFLRDWRDWNPLEAPPRASLGAQALMGCLALAGLMVLTCPPSLWAQYQANGKRPSPQQERAWYETSSLQSQMPYVVLQAVRQDVPRGSKVFYDYASNMLLPMMDNYYVAHSGFHLSIDLLGFIDAVREARGEPALGTDRYEDFKERTDYSVHCLKECPPVFSPQFTEEQDLHILKRLQVTHMIFDGTKYPHLVHLVENHPESLRTVRKVVDTQQAPPHEWYIVEVGWDRR